MQHVVVWFFQYPTLDLVLNRPYTDNKDKIKTIISHSLGSVLAHHIVVENEQLKGRLYSTPSLAIPHDRIAYFSHYGDPIAMFNYDTANRKLYLGNPHTYTGY